MAWALEVQTKKASTDNYEVITDAIDTTTATFIAVWAVNYQPGTDNTLSDSEGNTWTPLTEVSNATANRGRWYYCSNPNVSATHTFELESTFPSSSFPTIFVLAFSGGAAVPFDDEASDIGASSGATSTLCGEVTPSENDELILAGLGLYNTVTDVAVDSGFQTPETILTSSTNIPGGASYKILSGGSGTPVEASFTWTGGSFALGAHATFKVATAAGNPWYAYAQQ